MKTTSVFAKTLAEAGFGKGEIAKILALATLDNAVAATEAAAKVKKQAKAAPSDFDAACHKAAMDCPSISGIGGKRLVHATNPCTLMTGAGVIAAALEGNTAAMAELWYRATKKGSTPSSLSKGGRIKEEIRLAKANPSPLRKAMREAEAAEAKPVQHTGVPKRTKSKLFKANALKAAAEAMLNGDRQAAIFELKAAGLITDGRRFRCNSDGDPLEALIKSYGQAIKPVVKDTRIPSLKV